MRFSKKWKRQADDKSPVYNFFKNSGKAEAVRRGVLAGLNKKPQFIGYWDADLATPLSEISRFMNVLSKIDSSTFVCVARVKRLGADIKRHWYRHYLVRIIATIVSMILHLPTYDTQCGAKLFTADLGRSIFRRPFISKWLFDVELFGRVVATYGRVGAIRQIVEIPLSAWKVSAN